MQETNLESLLEKAKELEKRYEWLQATEYYNKAADFNRDEENNFKVAEIQEKIGYCYFRSAFQARVKSIFHKRMTSSALAYKKSAEYFQKCKNEITQIKENNSTSMIFYTKSWIETDFSKKKNLINQWWNLKSKVLVDFEKVGNKIEVAKTCNDILEGSYAFKYWLGTNWKEAEKIRNELISLGEKAITILSSLNQEYELARAYCWTSRYCLDNNTMMSEQPREIDQKAVEYSKKAIKLSIRTGDAWLIGWSNYIPPILIKNEFKSEENFPNSLVKYGKKSKDNYLLGLGKFLHIMRSFLAVSKHENPDKNRKMFENNKKLAHEVFRHFKIINMEIHNPYYTACIAYIGLASIELKLKTRYELLTKAVEFGRQGVKLQEGTTHSVRQTIINVLIWALSYLSKIETNVEKKSEILEEMINNTKRNIEIEKDYPYNYYVKSFSQYWLAIINFELWKIAVDNKKKDLTNVIITSIENSVKNIKIHLRNIRLDWVYKRYADFYYLFGGIYSKLYSAIDEKSFLLKAIEVFEESRILFQKVKVTPGVAEAYWQQAKIYGQLGKRKKASQFYELASKAYSLASNEIPVIDEFYRNYSSYMQAWSKIEEAKFSHSREDYQNARINYEKAGKLHEGLDNWSYLSPNYFAWAKLEQAEELSRAENLQEAIDNFQDTIEYFQKTKVAIKSKMKENPTSEEKDLITQILETSDLRCKYCEARILMDEAKLLDRKGKYLDSSINYQQAAQNISEIVDKIDMEAERKELEYLAILCKAWEKMAIAEETTSPEAYLESAELFEKAKNYCYTKKASLWALGNSNFCKGLAAGLRYKTSMDLKENAVAKHFIKDASSSYFEAGFNKASEYAKGTQRLFDAYAFMNQAENELDQEKRAKKYQMVENLLQIAAGSFMKAKQPDKQAKVQEILVNVREEKALAVSLSQVMQAPTIVSSTQSFSAPSPTSESSVGLEKFEHANIQANLVTTVKQVKVGESFCLSVEFVNAGREPALLLRVDDFVPSDFVVVKKPEIYRIEESCLNMKGKQLAPLKLVEVKLTLQPSKKGEFSLNPKVHYLDELGQNKSLQLKTLEIRVQEVIMEDRVSTGTEELDSLLLGGIPAEYAVVLSGPPSDEREMLVKNFLNAGADEGITFYVSTEISNLQDLLKNPNFYLFLCNPKPKTEVPDLPNVYKLQSKADITNLGIALTKAIRRIDQSVTQKRICIEILSDVLVKHGTNTTREWISSLITDLGAKGFTILAVMDPEMHPSDQSKAILNLFDGEICLLQSNDPLDCKKSIQVKKLRNQDYIKNPISLR